MSYVTLYIIKSLLSMRRYFKGCQLKSFNIAATLKVYLWSLDALFAALYWTASILVISLSWWSAILLKRTATVA